MGHSLDLHDPGWGPPWRSELSSGPAADLPCQPGGFPGPVGDVTDRGGERHNYNVQSLGCFGEQLGETEAKHGSLG